MLVRGVEPATHVSNPTSAVLTEYAWKFRYPGEPNEPAREETDGALYMARELHAAVVSRLPVELRG